MTNKKPESSSLYFNRRRALLLIILFVGILGMVWAINHTNLRMHEGLLKQAQQVVNNLDLILIQNLTGTSADIDNPAYLRLKNHFSALCSNNRDYRFMYLIGQKADGTVFFYVDNEPVGSEDESPAGMIYDDVPDGFKRVFATKLASTEGPYHDQWGTFVSGAVPLLNPNDHSIMAILCIDIDASSWKWNVLGSSIPPLTFCLILILILILYEMAHSMVKSWRYLDAATACVISLTLSAAVTWLVHIEEKVHNQEAFFQQTQSQAIHIAEEFHDLSTIKLEALGSFFESSQDINRSEFKKFVQFLNQDQLVQAWEWIPRITQDNMAKFIQSAQRDGFSGFTLWQKDESGIKSPVTPRPSYYPVYYAEPLTENLNAIGFDLGSEAIQYAALKDAINTRMITGTAPLALVQETTDQRSILVCRPVFENEASGQLRGFVLAVLRMDSLIETVLAHHIGSSLAIMDLYQLNNDGTKSFLASSYPNKDHFSGYTLSFPIFAFGKSLLLEVHPTRAYQQLYPVRAGFMAMLSGIVISISISLIITSLTNRRYKLEQQVAMRTKTLSESEARYHALIDSIDAGVLVIDPTTHIIEQVNQSACQMFGASDDQIIGQTCHRFLCPAKAGECPVTDHGQQIERSDRGHDLCR